MTNGMRGLLLVLPGLLGMRDPFEPPEDRCALGQLPLWHYVGMVANEKHRTGFVRDSTGKWRRLTQGQWFETRWQVAEIRPEQMTITLSAECEPSQWRWQKEGTKDAAKESAGTADVPGPAHRVNDKHPRPGKTDIAGG